MKRSDQFALGLCGLFAIGVLSASAQVITNPPIAVPIGCAYNTTPVTLTNGQAGWVQCTNAGKLQVDASVTPSGTQDINLLQVAGASVATGNGTAAGALRVALPTDGTGIVGAIPTASATGGSTISSAIAPATPAGVNLKAAAGTLYSFQATTIQATPVYVKFYNSASAPTCGSGTPVARFMVPVASTAANGAGTNMAFTVGIEFATGIGYCVTGALADNDTTAITAANTLVNIQWK